VTSPHIEIIGAGVAGLSCAWVFANAGCKVRLVAASNGPDDDCCSWWAGGMLAPWCELESTEPLIAELGLQSMAFWQSATSEVVEKGSLVVTKSRDLPDLQQFAERTRNFKHVDKEDINALEPDLADRFEHGLYFETECHLDPRKALYSLLDQLHSLDNVSLQFNQQASIDTSGRIMDTDVDWRIDCRGLSARDSLSDLRGVKGEMLQLESSELSLGRPIRLLHPRYPLYIVPRSNHQFMVGATMIESDETSAVTARSAMELLSAAYALHPAFAESTIVELGCDARPAFVDNLPRIRRRGKTVYINGLFRHGFLCGPAMAQHALDFILHEKVEDRVMDENRA